MNAMEWGSCFVWLPTRTLGGRWVWLRRAERMWDWRLNPWGYDGYSGTDGGWAYRLPLSPNVRANPAAAGSPARSA